jgi:Cyclin, N-terminal domain
LLTSHISFQHRCYQVVDFCKFRRETVGIGMSYLDRFLCTKKGEEALCNRKLYQLAAMTALYIAIKLHEPLEMETSLLADLSRGCYTEMEFVGMEQTILSALDFRVNGPTPLGFVQHFVAMMPKTVHPAVTDLLLDYARYQTELAVSEQSFASIKPSEIGLAAVLNAMEGMDQTLMPPNEQGRFVRLIEKNTELFVEEAERTQSKLSLLMVSMISKDYERIMNSMDNESGDAEVEKGAKQSLSRRNSPKSVIRR